MLAGALVVGLVTAAACGARTGLKVEVEPAVTPPSAQFCARADYRSGFSDVGLYLLIDKSGSMADDEKWSLTTSALAAFVDDPTVAGLQVGMQFFPHGFDCDTSFFAKPAVKLAKLPENAAAIKAALAAQKPDGVTPLDPALRGGIEYARGVQIADPSLAVVVAIVTDGSPDGCDSTIDGVAQLASGAVASAPQVLTFVLGLETGYVNDMRKISRAGGTGDPILIGKDPGSAQRIVDALEALRDEQRGCVFAVPAVYGADVAATDVSVSYLLEAGAAPARLALKPSFADCGSGVSGFVLDDPDRPGHVTLCPDACAAVHASTSSRVTVSVGCGDGAPDSGTIDASTPDGAQCGGSVSFTCQKSCTDDTQSPPICQGGVWLCPAGSVTSTSCSKCDPIPHGCCLGDGTLATASCVNGNWVCPPGAPMFGSPGCTPPTVCAPLMPCAADQYCQVPDLSCDEGAIAGRCAPVPASCPPGGAPACGCDNLLHASTCDAARAGIDLSLSGACSAPPGTFACGPLFCATASQICKKTLDLTVAIGSTSWACVDATAACPTGCGCGACLPCKQGLVCTESCQSSGGERTLLCEELPPPP